MPQIPVLTVVTYNVFGGGKFSTLRRPAIVESILGAPGMRPCAPDVICLQEATEDIIDALKNAVDFQYHVFTKLSYLRHSETFADQFEIARKQGFLAVLSRFPIVSHDIVHSGFCPHDGILKCSVLLPTSSDPSYSPPASPSHIPVTVYCYHGSGGTFNKSEQALLKRRRQREEELNVLREDILTDLTYNGVQDRPPSIVIVAGDFNSDCNDPQMFPDTVGYPEKVLEGKTVTGGTSSDNPKIRSYDVWMETHKSSEGSQTESHKHNTFRAWLKPSQKREATFDKIVVAHCTNDDSRLVCIEPLSIELIGNHKVATIAVDKNGNVASAEDADDSKESVDLFPSDHFGLIARLSACFAPS